MSDEYDSLLERLSDIEERLDQVERVVESTSELLGSLVEQVLEIRKVLSEPPPLPKFPS